MSALIIDGTDLSRPVFGSGGAAVINSALRNLHKDTVFVGATSSSEHVIGKWQKITYFKKTFRFLPVIHMNELIKPTVKSQNLQFALSVAKYIHRIKATGIHSVFTRTYTVLWLLLATPYSWDICYYYPGLGNPMLIGRKQRIGRLLARFYEIIQGICINHVTMCFAAASETAIGDYNRFLKKLGTKTIIKPLPTGVNTDLFRPRPKSSVRQKLGLSDHDTIFLYLGRLAKVKGIPLLLQSLVLICKTIQQAKLLIVGDGEEKMRLQEMCISLGIEKSVIFCGLLAPEEVALHICAADVCVVASETEGFSNAMIEQIACGKPIVSTAVSGAKELICEGKNGYIVHSRNPKKYAQKMINATHLFKAEEISRSIAVNNYSDKLLWETLQNQWPTIKICK